jgi:hypothetical protein
MQGPAFHLAAMVLAVAACQGPFTPPAPCEGVTCSGHGLCYETDGGWTLIAELDASEDACPEAWVHGDAPPVCHVPEPPGAGTDVPFPSLQGPYREVRGYLRGYQYNSTDAFGFSSGPLDGTYVDGVGIAMLVPFVR